VKGKTFQRKQKRVVVLGIFSNPKGGSCGLLELYIYIYIYIDV
jgi:hypothetical protein